MDLYTFTANSSRRILGDAATVFAIRGQHQRDDSHTHHEIPVLSLTGDENFPVSRQQIAEGLAHVLNETNPPKTLDWAGHRIGWVRHGQGLEIFIQGEEGHDSKARLFALTSGGCPPEIAQAVLKTLTDHGSVKNFFDNFRHDERPRPAAHAKHTI